MGQAIAIVSDYSAWELRKLARRERDGKVAARLLAFASALEGGQPRGSGSAGG
jgi:hypothetical protein